MRKLIAGFMLGYFLLASGAVAHEVPIETPSEFRADEGRITERPIALVFDDYQLQTLERKSREVLLTLLYSDITRMTYEQTARPRVLGVLPSQEDSSLDKDQHWLTIYFHQQETEAYLLLALDDYDADSIVQITQVLTEKIVEGASGE